MPSQNAELFSGESLAPTREKGAFDGYVNWESHEPMDLGATYGHRQSMTCLSLVTIPFHPVSMDENAHSNQQPNVVYVSSKGLEEV